MIVRISKMIIVFCLGMMLALFLKSSGFGYGYVSGHSMESTLTPNEFLLLTPPKNIKKNNIVIFNGWKSDSIYRVEDKSGKNSPYFIKRIIATAGDTVAYKNGKLYVNGKQQNQSYLSKENIQSGSLYKGQNWTLKTLSKQSTWNKQYRNTSRVPKGTVFVLGDNRKVSEDSRYFGYVKISNINNKAKGIKFS